MRASIPLSLRTLPLWLFAFVSPTVYFFSLLLANRFYAALRLPAAFYVALFVLISVGAFFFCIGAVWTGATTPSRKIGFTALTSLGLLFQLGVIAVTLHAILTTMIAYPQ